VFDEDISALFQSETRRTQVDGIYSLVSFEQSTGSNKTPSSHLSLKVGNETKSGEALGDGPVDSIFKAIDQITGLTPQLSRLVISPVTEGTDAMAEASVTIEYEGKRVVGKGDSTDIIEACAKAYIDALNRL
jgi:2-isopropylmalate synthase